MATHLIIDGYNLLGVGGHMGVGAADLEAARERLLQDLSRYRHQKGHAMTVVFDGWQQGLPSERVEHRAGVEVIFSRRGERADQVVQRLADQFGESCAVVSSDHDVALFARARGALVIPAPEFAARLAAGRGGRRGMPAATGKDDDRAEPWPRRTEKKGNPRKLPKAIRRRNRQMRGF
jgi:predicted RNA-binding protein with PIN domain